MIYVLVFMMGCILGSFYLVIATRLPKGEDVLFSRSHCDNCHKDLKWYNLIPVFSYIIQGGKCSFCQQKIDPLHLIVEIITGTMFLASYLYFGFGYNFLINLIIVSLTIIIYISDFKYMIILDSPLIVSSVFIINLKLIYLGLKPTLYSILCGICLFVIMLLVQQLGKFMFKRDALGGGDIKLSFVIGLLLDFRLGLIVLILSTFLALPYSVASLYLIKNNEVPYGPFLAGAMLIVFMLAPKFELLFDFLFRF